ncbi:PaaI family thioesterase [Polynucleobacter sp. HIN8]|uniref:PaaI family thioesterase n=1 Tax=Polynucleobacter sp. HIN8 TaxID=3047867 RepID=UPI0025738950|nr:PaaI family thioesterase [Polynucleobacter sp. HIN8]BEI38914.1 PaaI family thioesterase [Polynucleobacter sp. HIN8]
MPATRDEITTFFKKDFPQTKCQILEVSNRSALVSHPVGQEELRPGGTVSGPTMMALADVALYVAILGEIGIVPLTVTTSLNINFLRRPKPSQEIRAQSRLLKLGKSLVVGEVFIYSGSDPDPIAHATATYSIPPQS